MFGPNVLGDRNTVSESTVSNTHIESFTELTDFGAALSEYSRHSILLASENPSGKIGKILTLSGQACLEPTLAKCGSVLEA